MGFSTVANSCVCVQQPLLLRVLGVAGVITESVSVGMSLSTASLPRLRAALVGVAGTGMVLSHS